MNIPPQLPSDFDWVTLRHKCSMLKVFEELRLQAQRDVETAKQVVWEGKESPLEFATVDNIFSVVRKSYGEVSGVVFTLSQNEIYVTSKGKFRVEFTATLTLTDACECRLDVGGKILDRWQVLRMALEPLIFGRFDSR